jgi:hypothetical protein
MNFTSINPIRALALFGLMTLALSFLGLAFANSASAQFPSGCFEYEDPCIGGTDEAGENGGAGPGGGGGHNGFGPGGDGDGNGGSGTGDADGKLPFTGYPLTSLILLLLVLLASGLVIRGGTALREKFAHRA